MTKKTWRTLAAALLLVALGGRAEAAPTPKPTVLILVKRSSMPPLVKGVEANDRLAAAERAIDRAEAAHWQAMEAWEARATQAGGEPGPMPTLRLDEAEKLLREALALGGDLWPHGDAARYLLGWCLSETEQGAEAQRVWEALVERAPESPFAAETHLRLAERAFARGRLPDAARHYEAATGSPDATFAAFATYKLAWTRYLRGDRSGAIAAFRRVLAHPKAADPASSWGHMREDAVAFLGVILAEADWDGDDRMDPDAGPERALRLFPGDGPYDRDVLRAYLRTLRNEAAPDAPRAEAALRERGLLD